VTPLRRLYRLRPLAATFLCLPGVLLCAWYAWKAYSSLDNYRRVAREDVAFTLDDFQLSLHDTVTRDLRRMPMPSPPQASRLDRFVFHLKADAVDKLYGDGAESDEQEWVKARLDLGDRLAPVEIRLRGGKHWNLIGAQRSIKVKLESGDLYDGHRVFNLMNDPSPMVVGEELILDLAREHGVLTPSSSFARAFLNGADLGVMRYETQPDEGLLRLRRRMPGSIYSSNLPSAAKGEDLWKDHSHWSKPAWRDDSEREAYPELERLLGLLRSSTVRQFADFSRSEMDLEAFATFNALDIVFGVDQHDFRDNHKLYYDPYRGRFEPIAWNFRGYKHEAAFNLVENPILLRLEMVPEYLSIRGRILHDLLVGDARVSALERRGRRLMKRLEPELESDANFDAYKMLPGVDRFHRQMLRPMTVDRAMMVLRSELSTYAARHAFLLGEIQANPLWLRTGDPAAPPADGTRPAADAIARYRTPVDLIVDGQAGVSLEELRVSWPDGCEAPEWQVLWQDGTLAAAARGDVAVIDSPLALHPRISIVRKGGAAGDRESARAVPAPSRYPLEIISTCAPREVVAWGTHMATGSRVRSRPAPESLIDRLPGASLDPDAVPSFVHGEVSPDPWHFRRPAPEAVALGPGVVDVPETRVFGAHQTVEVAPGTTLRMGAGASIVFLGRVRFAGKADSPIVIEPAGTAPFGGVAVQGPATAGSSLEHVVISGGTRPSWRLIPYPGMIDLHHSEDITVRHCRLGGNSASDDVLHVAYVEDLLVEDSTVEGAAMDSIDMEFSSGTLRRVSLLRSGDDGLDLMGSRISLIDSAIMGCAGNAVSAGEETEAKVRDTLLAGCKVGALAKNASTITLAGALLFQNEVGARVYRREVRYAGASLIEADALYAVSCGAATRTDDDSKDALALGRIERRAPSDGSLDHLLEDVLTMSSFDELDVRVSQFMPAREP